MRVLLVKLSALGDIVHAFPAVEEAKEHLPRVEIDWLVDAAHLELVRRHGGAQQVVALGTPPPSGATGYDVVIDAQGLLRSAVAARCRGNRVVGASGKLVREWPSHWLYAQRVLYPSGIHAVDEIRSLFAAALNYEAEPGSRVLTNLRRHATRPGGELVPLFHGTAQRCKVWPSDRWIALACLLVSRGLHPVVVGKSDEELAFCRNMVAAVPEVRFHAHADMEALTALIDAAAFCISVDTGLGHLADWRGCPTVMLFQASDPIRTGTYFASSRSIWAGVRPQRPRRSDRNKTCRNDIVSPDAVMDALGDWMP